MSQTEGRWTAKTSFPDLQLFIGADQFTDLTGNATRSATSTVSTQLGVASPYALLAATGITNTGNTVITGGNIATTPTTTVTGFPNGVVVTPGITDQTNATAAQTALAAAIVYYKGLTATVAGLTNLSTGGNGSTASTYTPGVYVGSGALTMPTGIILDAQGNPNATFVFVSGSTINLASGQAVQLVNGAQAANVVFVAGSSFTSVATSTVNGNVLAAVSITLGGGVLNGRALANTGAVTISAATIITNPKSYSATAGLAPLIIPAGAASAFIVTPEALLLRSGVYGSAAYGQQQFGTAAGVPGPSLVSGTAWPGDATESGSPNYQGFPPFPGAKMATLTGGVAGPIPKGVQIDSVDVIYQILTDSTGATATVGLTQTNFANLVAPVVSNLITLGTHGLPIIIGAQPQVTNILVTTPVMIVAADTQIMLSINLASGIAGTIAFHGAVLKAHYNFA